MGDPGPARVVRAPLGEAACEGAEDRRELAARLEAPLGRLVEWKRFARERRARLTRERDPAVLAEWRAVEAGAMAGACE